MTRTVGINERQRLNIVIDDIIFLKKTGAAADLEQRAIAPLVVIEDTIFLKMQEGNTISLGSSGIERNDSNIRLQVNETPVPRNVSHDRLIVLDPNECFIEMDTDTIMVRKWIDDNGIRRKLFEEYDLDELAYLTAVRDKSSGRVVLNLCRLDTT